MTTLKYVFEVDPVLSETKELEEFYEIISRLNILIAFIAFSAE